MHPRSEGMRFDGVLLASDYDGTLACSDGISGDVKRAIRFFIAGGGRFTVCTGRTRPGFHAYSPELMNAPVLLANGGTAYDYARERVAVDNGIGDEGLEPLRAVQRRFPDVCIEMYSLERGYALNLSPQSEHHFTSQGIPFDAVDAPEQAPRPWSKAMMSGTRESIARVQAFLRERWPQIAFLPTDGRFLEVMKRGVDKGTALLGLADALGISHEHVYAVGDGYNDVEMLRAARMGFVPANGDAFALAAADRVVRSNEEGAVAHVIEILSGMYPDGGEEGETSEATGCV